MSCSTCGNRFPVSQSNPCSSCQQRQDSCDDAIQIAYVPGTACTIGITYNCVTTTLSLKEGIQNCETDTKLVWDPVSGCIQYHSERYVNQFEGATLQVVCASEIANAINLCELADVADTACDPNNCALFVYQKDTSCGENCKGVNDKWVPWTATEHKADYLTYVMGFNDEGCPIALDKPNPTSDYWFAMWRGDGKFGYIKPANGNLPKDGNGNTLVISQESNGKPIIGPLDIKGYLNEKECTYFDPAPGYEKANPGGNEVCYYKNQDMLSVVLDLNVSATRTAKVYFNEHIATIHDPRFYPKIGDGEFVDLPLHAVWDNDTNGAISPIWLRIDKDGRLLLSGSVGARGNGKSKAIASGIDDNIKWPWKG